MANIGNGVFLDVYKRQPWELVLPEAGVANRKEAANHGRVSDWGEVVTR